MALLQVRATAARRVPSWVSVPECRLGKRRSVPMRTPEGFFRLLSLLAVGKLLVYDKVLQALSKECLQYATRLFTVTRH